jgi:hypothetical protein
MPRIRTDHRRREMMNVVQLQPERSAPIQMPVDTRRYAKCIEVSKRIRWEIDRDVIRGRRFDFSRKFLPDALSKLDALEFLSGDERKCASHVQGRTYANMFGLVERFISAKILEVSREHWLGDQTAFEALVRFTDEELKHQELFRRIERMIASDMPEGYEFVSHPNEVAGLVLGKSTWGVLALTCLIEIISQAHYRQSIDSDPEVSELFKDIFAFHWKEESQHAILDELEWRREHDRLTARERDEGVNDLIALALAIDASLQQQSKVDADYFVSLISRPLSSDETRRVREGFLEAYRWQYILSGAQEERFVSVLKELATEEQCARIGAALAPMAQGA